MSADDTPGAGVRSRTVPLLRDVDARLMAYAKARHMAPEAAAAEAIAAHLREHGDIAQRIADARSTYERHNRG